jgi:acyl-CoA synthetase (AMP-forming)/AMP-acid ligase II
MTTTAATGIRCIADIVRVHARDHGDRPALTAGQQTVTFSGFYARAQAVAGALLESGVRSQDRIAVIDHDGIETLEVVFGAASLNGSDHKRQLEVEFSGDPPDSQRRADDRWGEAVKAIVVAAPGSPPPSPEALIAFSREQLAAYKCPKTVDFATTLPRNPSGKLLKLELRAPYWKGAERQVG